MRSATRTSCLFRNDTDGWLKVVVRVEGVDTKVSTVIEKRRHVVVDKASKDTHDKPLEILRIHLAFLVMATELALDDPKENLDWVVEGAVGREKDGHNPSSPQVVNDVRVAMNLGTVKNPNRARARVSAHSARFHEFLAALEELEPSEGAFRGWAVDEATGSDEAKQGDARKADVLASDVERGSRRPITMGTAHRTVVKGYLVEKQKGGDVPHQRLELVVEANDVVELYIDGSAFQFLGKDASFGVSGNTMRRSV